MKIVLVRQGVKYGHEYVTALRKMLHKHTGAYPVVLGDQEDADTTLQTSLTGWWAKMELFAPHTEHLRPCFFLDLDTYVLSDIRDVFDLPRDRLWLIRDFMSPRRSNSGLVIVPHETSHIWDKFERSRGDSEVMKYGDGDFLRQFGHDILQNRLNGIYSFKVDCREYLPGDARIVCFHGKPKPHEIESGWARDVWTANTT